MALGKIKSGFLQAPIVSVRGWVSVACVRGGIHEYAQFQACAHGSRRARMRHVDMYDPSEVAHSVVVRTSLPTVTRRVPWCE
jgi:hypothetical protein